MLLAIDVGNTRVKVSDMQGRGKSATASIEKITNKQDAEFLFDRIDKPSCIMGASVVPAIQSLIDDGVKKIYGLEPVWLDASLPLGLEILYKTPNTLGADRLANALGAIELYPLPCVVVDFGTATKLDLINGAGNYVGGAIMPGVRISLDALHRLTAKLPALKPEWPTGSVGQDTKSSILDGTVVGHAHAIAGLIDDYERLLGEKISVVATGGDVATFLEQPSPISMAIVNHNLTMVGLLAAAKRLGLSA